MIKYCLGFFPHFVRLNPRRQLDETEPLSRS